jgi:hypothetical protein
MELAKRVKFFYLVGLLFFLFFFYRLLIWSSRSLNVGFPPVGVLLKEYKPTS